MISGVIVVGLFADNPIPMETTSGRSGLFKGLLLFLNIKNSCNKLPYLATVALPQKQIKFRAHAYNLSV